MHRFRNVMFALIAGVTLSMAAPCAAATLTNHNTEADFLAAVPAATTLSSEDWDGFAAGTVISNQVAGVTFSSPNDGLPGFVPVQTRSLPQAISSPNALGGGSVESQTVEQVIMMEFDLPASALSFVLVAQNSVREGVTVRYDFMDGSSQTMGIPDADGTNNNTEFYGVTSDTPFTRVTVTSSDASEGQFQNFGGLDNQIFNTVDLLPPICDGVVSDIDGVLTLDGTGTDDRPGDTGIASVSLSADSTNLTLTVDPAFVPGDPTVSYRVQPTDPLQSAVGTVEVFDGAGNGCTQCLDFRFLPDGPLTTQDLCCDDPIFFSITNENPTPAGAAFCTTDQVDPNELPPGYEPLAQCREIIIQSPVSGITEMFMEVPGDYNPDLRLLFAPFNGVDFDPYVDATEFSIPILTIPDPTRITGKKKWSPVKVACALLTDACAAGGDDLMIDEDEDGFLLCDPTPENSDCNDSNPLINPGTDELCNGLDDDCDGVRDEDNPEEMACTVDGLLGACAESLTECLLSELTCSQTVFPDEETCDGVDNDCDGAIDNDAVDAPTWYADTDGDGFGDPASSTESCEQPAGFVANDGDCDDGDAAINPDATEVCDGIDNNCDGQVDEGFDVDGDGFTSCGGDCDDDDAAINPDATEVCDGVDNDCDGNIDEGFDVDGDGFTSCGGDCDDGDAAINPDATEVCDGIDNNCDGNIDEGFDVDADGFTSCGGDCNDGDASINPDATEVCDGVDNNCSGVIDDTFVGVGLQCGTTDVGECEFGTTVCAGGIIVCAGDVDPVPEVCGDGLDNDCNGLSDEAVEIVATCTTNQTLLNTNSEGTNVQFSIFSATNICDPTNPIEMNRADMTTAYISQAGPTVLPDPFSQACPDPILGTLFERGIVENLPGRKVTGSAVKVKFETEADGDCTTLDGSRQEILAVLADVVDDTQVPLCISSSIDGTEFTCCAEATVRNDGLR